MATEYELDGRTVATVLDGSSYCLVSDGDSVLGRGNSINEVLVAAVKGYDYTKGLMVDAHVYTRSKGCTYYHQGTMSDCDPRLKYAIFLQTKKRRSSSRTQCGIA